MELFRVQKMTNTWKLKMITKKLLASFYFFKVNSRNTRNRCQICSKLTLKTPERRQICSKLTPFSSVSIVDFEQLNFSWVAAVGYFDKHC